MFLQDSCGGWQEGQSSHANLQNQHSIFWHWSKFFLEGPSDFLQLVKCLPAAITTFIIIAVNQNIPKHQKYLWPEKNCEKTDSPPHY